MPDGKGEKFLAGFNIPTVIGYCIFFFIDI